MYIIIAGSGILGFYTAQFLSKKGNDIVIIEGEKSRAEEITDKLDATIINGDATEIKTLQEAGIEQADVVLATTGSDDTNILVCILAKQLGAKRTICRITHIEYSESLFKKLGIDSVFYPELTTATQVEEMVRDPNVSGFALLDDGETEMVELKVKDNSPLAGSKISKIKLPKGSQVISIIRPNKEKEAAYPETVLQKGDKVLVLTDKDDIASVEKVFSK
jgi:trk system potassium uptake protein TrkA